MKSEEHHRYRSWEYCYGYFRGADPKDIEQAALHLGFYLASWGMYRGSSFLLQSAYPVHLGVIKILLKPQFSILREQEFGAGSNDAEFVPRIQDAVNEIRGAYADLGRPTDTLVTKIILGTLGCLPAYDAYFIDGFKSEQKTFSNLKSKEGFNESVGDILRFCHDNLQDLQAEQRRIEDIGAVRYPLMKLVDMYFWQIGFKRRQEAKEQKNT